MSDDQWTVAPQHRQEGFECLTFHRGKWHHVRWSRVQMRWSMGYAGPFLEDGDRPFAPLPDNTPDRKVMGNGFYDFRR